MAGQVGEHHFVSFAQACEVLKFHNQVLLQSDDFLQLTDVERCALVEAFMGGKQLGFLVVHGTQGLEPQMRAAEQRVALVGNQLALFTINPRLPKAAHGFVLVFANKEPGLISGMDPRSASGMTDLECNALVLLPTKLKERQGNRIISQKISKNLVKIPVIPNADPGSSIFSSVESKNTSENLLQGLGEILWLEPKPVLAVHEQAPVEPEILVITSLEAMRTLLTSYAQERAACLGKQVQFVMVGVIDEIEPRLLQQLAEILQALVGNCVEHGIEQPATRRERDKPEAGVVTVQWVLQGDLVCVTVQDDGVGVALDLLREALVRECVLTVEMAQFLAPDELSDYFFSHTFNDWHANETRGPIALPQVRERVRSLGGKVHMHVSAAGTMVRLVVPLTMPDDLPRVRLRDVVRSFVHRVRRWFGG